MDFIVFLNNFQIFPFIHDLYAAIANFTNRKDSNRPTVGNISRKSSQNRLIGGGEQTVFDNQAQSFRSRTDSPMQSLNDDLDPDINGSGSQMHNRRKSRPRKI